MTWKVNIHDRVEGPLVVEHSESQTAFEVKLEGKQPSKAQARLIPPSGKVLPWTGAALEEVEKEIQKAFEAEWAKEKRRLRLQELVQTKLDSNTREAANVISRATGRKVSHRSVQAWEIPSNQKSSRSCPQWALDALEAYVPPAQPQMVAFDRNRWLLENQVLLAGRRLENEENWFKRWDKVPISELGKKIAYLDIFLTRYVSKLEKELHVFTCALRTCQTFEEFKVQVQDERNRIGTHEYAVHTTAQAIRDGREEFSNPDGLPESNGDDPHYPSNNREELDRLYSAP